MILLITLGAVTTIFLILAFALIPTANNDLMRVRIHEDRNKEDSFDLRLRKKFRAGKALYKMIHAIIVKILPLHASLENTEEKIRAAKLGDKISAVDYTIFRISLVFLVTLMNISASIIFKQSMEAFWLVVVIVGVYWFPDYLLHSRAIQYERKLTSQLPQAIEMLLICAESGMGLVSSFQVVAERKGGIIGQELEICLHEIEIGISINDSLSNFRKRNRSKEVQVFVNTITQAMRMGTMISSVLRNLAGTIRDYERQRVENIIGSLPMKLTIVTMLFFMPLVFIIVLFPSLLSFMQSGW